MQPPIRGDEAETYLRKLDRDGRRDQPRKRRCRAAIDQPVQERGALNLGLERRDETDDQRDRGED